MRRSGELLSQFDARGGDRSKSRGAHTFVLTESSPRVVRQSFKKIFFVTISIFYDEKHRNNSLIQEAAQNSHTNTKDEKSTTNATETPWLNEARTTAAAELSARENGQVVPAASPQPWVATAMLEALDKYDALARARSSSDRDATADNPDQIR